MRKFVALVALLAAALMAGLAVVAVASGANPSFTFNSSATGATWTCSLDSSPATACSGSASYSNLSSGQHNATLTSTFTVSPSSPSSLLVGVTSVEGTADSNPAGSAQGWSFTAASSGTASTISFYADWGNAASAIKLGLYSDASGAPGALLARATVSSPKSSGWNTATLSSSPSVTSGTKYWLVALGTGGTLNFRDGGAGGSGCATVVSSQGGMTSLPQTFKTGQTWNSYCPASFYVSSSGAASPPSTASFTFSSDESGATWTCALDGGAASACSSPKSYSSLAAGSHTVTLKSAFTVSSPPSSSTLVGNSTTQSASDNNPAGSAQGWSYIASASGTATSISFYADSSNAASAVKLGLYSDAGGAPGTLLDSASVSSPKAGAWNTANLTAGASLISGTKYWLAALGTGGTLAFRDSASGTGCSTVVSSKGGMTSLPQSFSTGQTWNGYCPASFYVNGTGSAASPPPPAPPAPPSNSGLPVVSGSAVQGGVLSTSNGSWSGSPTGYGYQWEDCDGSGAGCVSVAGATASSYTLQASDVGHTVRAVVTASNGAGSTSAVSAQTGVVTAPASAPSMTAAPQITGTASQGNRLSGSSGSWSGTTPMSYGYQWEDCDSSGAGCVNVAGATASTYTLQASDVGHTMRVAVTASNSAGSGSGTSGQSAMVSASSGSGPTDTAAPTITGVADTGSFVAPQLVASSGSWSGSPTRYTYQWQDCNSSGANCVNAAGETYGPGASGSSCVTTVAANGCAYNLVAKEATAPCPYASGATGACTIGLIVTATNAQGSTPVSVAPVGPVKASSTAWPNFSNTGYQNAPGYPGTAGVPDPSKLTIASAGSSTCPTTIQSNHTYSFCHYTGGLDVGASGQDVSNVHFIGDLFDDSSPYGDSEAIILYCDNNCTFDYVTVSPTGMSVPDLPMPGHGLNWNGNQIGHGVTYSKGYGAICACGWGAHNSVGHGFSFTHSDMWGWGSGIITGPNTSATPITIQNNWIHDEGDCDSDNNCSEHTDGIGMVDTGSTSSYITIDHNNMPFILNNTNDLAFQQGTYNHLNITNNILSGDGNTVAIWHTSTNITFTGNLWTNYAQQEYGVNYGEDFWDTTGSTWAHNKFAWDPTGVTTLYQNGPNPFDNYTPSGTQYTTTNNNQCWVPTGLSTTDYGGGTC